MDLLKRRDEIVADHKAMERHNPYAKADADRGDRLSDRPVAFLCDDEVVVVGPCVAKVLAAVKKFVDALGAKHEDPQFQATNAHDHGCYKRCLKLLAVQPPPAEIRVPQQVWNAYLHALGEVGVKAVLAEGTFAPEV